MTTCPESARVSFFKIVNSLNFDFASSELNYTKLILQTIPHKLHLDQNFIIKKRDLNFQMMTANMWRYLLINLNHTLQISRAGHQLIHIVHKVLTKVQVSYF